MKKIIRTGCILYMVLCVYIVFWWKTFNANESFYLTRTFTPDVPWVNKTKIEQGTGEKLRTWTREFNITTVNQNWHWSEANDQELYKGTFKNESFCDRQFIVYEKLFARLDNVVIDPSFAQGRKGGENISDVLNQNEADEYFHLNKGYFTMKCSATITYQFAGKSHLNDWTKALNITKEERNHKTKLDQWSIAILRYEYANLYHTMTDFYNAFLLAKAFNILPDNITIFWIDGHPAGALDVTWQKLFGKVLRAGEIEEPVHFKHLLWGIMGYQSYLNQHNRPSVPFLEEFRRFFLNRHGINHESSLNCKNLTVLLLWRRDYLAHPRNPSGSVSRKIKNEDELLDSAKSILPGHNVFGVQIDQYPMEQQLFVISKTDILIGMHGAGLSHTLFLPRHSGLIELYPNYWSTANKHFRSMAKWRNLQYLSWRNVDGSKELANKYTIINSDAVINMLKQMQANMCS